MKTIFNCPALDNNKCFISNDKCKCDDYKQCELYKTYVVRPNYDALSNSIGAVYLGNNDVRKNTEDLNSKGN